MNKFAQDGSLWKTGTAGFLGKPRGWWRT